MARMFLWIFASKKDCWKPANPKYFTNKSIFRKDESINFQNLILFLFCQFSPARPHNEN